MKPVWIVDDDKSIRWVLEKTLSREQIPFKSFASANEALAQLDAGAETPQVLVSDIRMPGQSGLDLLQQVKARFPTLPVIIMTAYSDLESAVAAFQGGAFEYLPKPFDVDQALELIRRAIDESTHKSGAPEAIGLTPEILGQASAMQEVFRAIGRLSQSNATVMVTGESGSGKELVARAVHRHSPRRPRPAVWRSATNTLPAGAPCAARSSSTLLLDSHSANASTSKRPRTAPSNACRRAGSINGTGGTGRLVTALCSRKTLSISETPKRNIPPSLGIIADYPGG